MSDRDGVDHFTVKNIDADTIYFQCISVDREDTPPIKGVVRMYMAINCIVRANKESPNDTVDYCEMSIYDMKGYVPARLLNMVMASESLKEFKNMH